MYVLYIHILKKLFATYLNLPFHWASVFYLATLLGAKMPGLRTTKFIYVFPL